MKARKVIRSVLLGLLGLLLVLLVTLQIVLRPSVLTGIVNGVAADFVPEGNVSFREVKAHVIKSFPYVNLEVGDFCLTYPHERYARYDTLYPDNHRRFSLLKAGYGPQVDTLASLQSLRVSFNYMAFLRKSVYHIHKVELEHPRIFAHYFDSTAANWDILPLGGSKDTTSKPLPAIIVNKVSLTGRPLIVFTNPSDTLHGLFTLRRMALDGVLDTREPQQARSRLELDSLFVSGRLPADTVSLRLENLTAGVDRRHLDLQAKASAHLRTGSLGRLRVPIEVSANVDFPEHEPGELGAQVNRLFLKLSAIGLEGAGSVWKRPGGVLDLDLEAAIKDCQLNQLISEYRSNFDFLKKLDTDARINLEAAVKGSYGGGATPSIQAHLLVPASTIDYEGLGRKGRLALDASVNTDNLQQVDANVDRLLVDIAGARINASGKARDILGKDPLLQLSGSANARLDSLTRAFTQEMGLSGTGNLNMQLRAKARLSQLNAARVGQADINCDLKGQDLSVHYAPDSVVALLPQVDVNLSTRGNTIDSNLRQGARVLGLKALIDTLDVSYGSMFVRGGKLNILMQNSADVLQGTSDRSSIMGLLRVGNLRMRDRDGLALGLRSSTERFRLEPASKERPVPRLNLGSQSGALRVRMGQDVYSLRDVNFDIFAMKHQSRRPSSERMGHLLDSLQRIYPGVPRDSLFRRARMDRLALQSRDDFSKADISISLSDALKQYFRTWDVDGKLDLGSGSIRMAAFPLRTGISAVKGSFDNDTLDLQNITLTAGASDISAQAKLTGLRRAVLGSTRSKLLLKVGVQSNHLDANELLRGYAAYAQAKASGTPADTLTLPDAPASSSLIVIPANLEVNFSLEANSIVYDSLQISWAAADVAMRNRTIQVTNALAATNMGDMYFEGFYTTRSKEDIQAGFDLNLVDITAQKVITLFPAIDTILPMLTSFAGDLDCELAATSAIDTCMNLILPSIDGVMRISGKDLTLKDSEEFSRLAGKLMFKDKSKAHIDNMSVTGIVQNNTLEVFPFVLDVDRYLLAASGWQHLDKDFQYHISVIRSPLLVKLGINAWGPDFDNIHYDLTKPLYRSINVPVYTKQLDTVQYSLVAAIHNIFELGVEKAMAQNRSAAVAVTELSEATSQPLPEDQEPLAQAGSERLTGLIEDVNTSVASRREALKQEVLRLEREAALKYR